MKFKKCEEPKKKVLYLLKVHNKEIYKKESRATGIQDRDGDVYTTIRVTEDGKETLT